MLKGTYELLKGYENNHVTIGFGSYGQVKLAKNLDTGQIVAVKIINKIAKNQIIFHNKLSHPKIIQLLNYQIDKQKQITYMVLEYAESGTLFQRIKMEPIPKKQVKKFFKDVLQAVAYLHGKEIMHRDIKPQNILLTKSGQAKLCDFGFAAILGERKTLCGTYQYMSPQMIQNKPYDFKIDIWALGILLFEMISGQAPFRGQTPQEVINQMKTKIFFCQRFEPEQINLIKMILRVTPSKRPTVFQILENSYFNDDQKLSQKSSQTIETQVKKLNSASSIPNFQKQKSESQKQSEFGTTTFSHFSKKIQYKQSLKNPQNSYPFYVPKGKYNTGSSTGSNGNSGSGVSTNNNVIMPQSIIQKKQQKSYNNEKNTDRKAVSPTNRRKLMQYQGYKKNNQYQTNPKQQPFNNQNSLFQPNPSSNSVSNLQKLNYSMGQGMKTKLASLHNYENKDNIQPQSYTSISKQFINANSNQHANSQTVISNYTSQPPLKGNYMSHNQNKSQSGSYSYGAFNANMKRFS